MRRVLLSGRAAGGCTNADTANHDDGQNLPNTFVPSAKNVRAVSSAFCKEEEVRCVRRRCGLDENSGSGSELEWEEEERRTVWRTGVGCGRRDANVLSALVGFLQPQSQAPRGRFKEDLAAHARPVTTDIGSLYFGVLRVDGVVVRKVVPCVELVWRRCAPAARDTGRRTKASFVYVGVREDHVKLTKSQRRRPL